MMSSSNKKMGIVPDDSLPSSKFSGMRLGIITCAHGNAPAVRKLCKAYEKNNADAIAICGDLGDNYKEINSVLIAAKTKLPTIAFPGSHEPAKDYYRALKKNKKVIDGTKNRRTTIKGYDIITLPGSGVNTSNAGFRIAGKRLPKEYLKRFKLFYISNLGSFIRNPEKTIILAHDPPKGTNNEGIDVAYSGIVSKMFVIKPKHYKKLGKQLFGPFGIAAKGEIFTEPYAGKIAKLGYPVKVMNRNVGNEDLKKFLSQKKIRFFACGHIHEAGQRAITSTGKPLRPCETSKTVWYNAAPAAKGRGGMLILQAKKAAYKNITV